MKKLGFLFILFLVFNLRLKADEDSFLSFGVGSFDVLRYKRLYEFQIEYKDERNYKGFQPIVGAYVTSKNSVYLFSGICYEILFKDKFVLTPSFSPGVYFKRGGKDLGSPLEFRSSISAAYKFEDNYRIGVQFYHLSNASLGYKNPGEESFMIFYGVSF